MSTYRILTYIHTRFSHDSILPFFLLYNKCLKSIFKEYCISFDNLKRVFNFSEMIARIDKIVLQDEELASYKQGMLLQRNPIISNFLNVIYSGRFFRTLFSFTHKQGFLRDVCYHIFLAIYVKERQKKNG